MTLKEAVESGRRWRLKTRHYLDGGWFGPNEPCEARLTPKEALSSDFEIEPEPEKPREFHIHACEEHGAIRIGDDFCLSQKVIRVHDADACDRLNHCQRCGTRFRCPHQCGWPR